MYIDTFVQFCNFQHESFYQLKLRFQNSASIQGQALLSIMLVSYESLLFFFFVCVCVCGTEWNLKLLNLNICGINRIYTILSYFSGKTYTFPMQFIP